MTDVITCKLHRYLVNKIRVRNLYHLLKMSLRDLLSDVERVQIVNLKEEDYSE